MASKRRHAGSRSQPGLELAPGLDEQQLWGGTTPCWGSGRLQCRWTTARLARILTAREPLRSSAAAARDDECLSSAARARIGAVRAAALPAEAGVSPSSASALLPLLRSSRGAETGGSRSLRLGAIATHKSSSAAQNQEPRVSGARPALCPDTAKGRHPNLFAKTLLDDLPSNCIFPAPDTVHIRSAPGSQRKNYGKRPATDVHCCASSTSPSLTAPSSVSCDPGRRDAKLFAGDSVSAAGSLVRAAKEPGAAWTAAALSILPGPPMAATPGARVVVLRFDQAQADQSPVLIDALDRVAVEL